MLHLYFNTVKAFDVTSLNDKKLHNFNRGYDKGYKNFIADENLFACI